MTPVEFHRFLEARLRGVAVALGRFPDECFPDGVFRLHVSLDGNGRCVVALSREDFERARVVVEKARAADIAE